MNRFLLRLQLCFILVLLAGRAGAQLTANFGASPFSGCSPIVVQFTDSSTGGAVNWLWNLGNGTTSTLQNPSKTYTTPGTYSITLTVTDAAGASSTKVKSNIITVVAKPEIMFSASDSTPGCVPKTVAFTSGVVAGIPGGLTYTWDFGDGTLSSLPNPTHTYTTTGNFDVTLSVTSAQGCNKALTKTAYIKTSPKPISAFSFSGNTSCTLPATITFANTTAGSTLTGYAWTFDNGQTSATANPTVVYSAAGTYAVRLISTVPGSGCADTLTQNVVVTAAKPQAAFTGPATGCNGAAVAFTNTTTPLPASSNWNFGDGTGSTTASPSKTYATAGTYTVRLIVTAAGGCSDTLIKSITITPAPVAGFSLNPLPATSCSVPKTFTLTNTSTGATGYSWAFGDGTGSTAISPAKTYTSFGTYTIVLTATGANGCTATAANTTVTLAPPTLSIAVAYPTGACVPAGVAFTNSFSALDAGTTYSWSFGDGTTGTGAAPVHTYSTTGSYTVTLTATAGNGCTATATTTVNVGTKPTTAFTASPLTACTNVPVMFSNTSAGGTTYNWNFGDGSTATTANPNHSYDAAGTYTVTLVVSNNGCKDTLVRPAYITILDPQAQFTDNFLCSNKALHNFTNTSVGALTYLWDFGDGTTSTATSPSHTYATTGGFNVTLTAINGACSSVVTKRIYIYNLNPQFAGTPLPICKGQAVAFTLQNSAHMQSVAWNFGDGTGLPVATPAPVSKTYTTTGSYTITVYATDSAGCTDTLAKPAYVLVRGIEVNFSGNPLGGCPGMAVTFTDISAVAAGGSTTARSWSFGDGSTLSGNVAAPVKTYSTTGVYSVKLKVTDSYGCTDSLLKPTYIEIAKPIADFSFGISIACVGKSVVFTNASAGGTTYDWNFGDSTTSTAASPFKVYIVSGTYNVRLIATNTFGCKDTITKTVLINIVSPLAQFTVSDSVAPCPPLSVQFSVPPSAGTTYKWTFGNGATATVSNPSTLYSTAGTFTAKLVATNAAGCKDSTTKTIQVNGPAGTISFMPVSGCAPLPVTFTVNAINTVSYTFDFDNGSTFTSAFPTAAHTYTTGGNFRPVVILSNGAGCNVAVESLDTLKISSLNAGFTVSDSSFCLGKTIQFTDTSKSVLGGPVSRLWTFGDGTTSTATTPDKTFTTAGVYTVTLRVTNGICTDSATKIITVEAVPVQLVSANGSICTGISATLTATGAATYQWSPGATLSCTTCAAPVATPAVTTTYTVVGTAANGCSDTDQVTLTVEPLPVVSAGPDKAICPGAGAVLTATGAASYLWSPATGLSCTACAAPTASPAGTTTYVVTGTNPAGCTSTDTVVVTVTPSLVLTTNGPQSICAGGSVALSVSGATTYSWSPATGLSCTTCATPTASPAGTTTYTVTGSTPGGCTGTATLVVTVKPLPIVSVAPNPAAICAGGSEVLTATGAATYSWSGGTGLSCTACAAPTASPAASTTYAVTGTAANGCTAAATVYVAVNPLPVVTATASQAAPCALTPVTLTAGGAASYVWSGGAGLSCTACASPTALPTAATTYTVAGTSAAGCTGTATITITPKPLPVLVTANAAICAGGSVPLSVSGAATYVWSPVTGLSCTACAAPTASPAGTTTYTITGTAANGCTDTASVRVTVNPIPVVSAGPNREVCAGVGAPLDATGAVSYVWSPAAGLSCTTCANPVATLTATATYTVTGTSAAGCIGSATVVLTVVPRKPVSIETPKPICEGQSTVLLAGGGDSYSWSPAGSLSASNTPNPTAAPTKTTTYTVIIKQGNCYADTLTATVGVFPLPTVDAGPDRTLTAGSNSQLVTTATDANTYNWLPAATLSCTTCSAPMALPLETTTYTVVVTSVAGCTASDAVTLSLQCDNSQLFLPNTFTPNGDGANDFFYPRGKGVREVRSFRVYSRWGELLYLAENFQLNEETKGWNGTFKGVPLKPDVYVWVVDAICDTGVPLQQKGDVSIVK